MDPQSPAQRSENMRRIRRRDTRCEIALRRAVFAAGGRYRVDDPKVPGRPDFTFRKAQVAVFLDSRFWHGKLPDERIEAMTNYWIKKLYRNRERDNEVNSALVGAGWVVVRVDEKQALRDSRRIAAAIMQLVSRPGAPRVVTALTVEQG